MNTKYKEKKIKKKQNFFLLNLVHFYFNLIPIKILNFKLNCNF